jgi:hypothetical protein
MKTSLTLRTVVPWLSGSLCILLCSSVWAQDAKVRVSVATNDTIWVGQRVTLVVELLAPGFFASAAAFDLPDPRGLLLLPPKDHPVVSSEMIEDTSYTVQRHELSVFAQSAGKQTVPSFKARFAFKRAPLDTNVVSASVTTSPVQFTVASPPGAEHLGNVISARNLKVEETWQPKPDKTNVSAGAAFTRTITFSAPDVPGMVFPPFPAGQIDGLGIYTKRQVTDQTERGALTGERRDIITYVCQRPGQFTIPATRLLWFDLETKQLQTNDFPAFTLKVIPNAAMTSNTEASNSFGGSTASALTTAQERRRVALGFGGFVGFALLFGLLWKTRHFWYGVAAEFRPLHLRPLNPISNHESYQPYQSSTRTFEQRRAMRDA